VPVDSATGEVDADGVMGSRSTWTGVRSISAWTPRGCVTIWASCRPAVMRC